ncbi:NADPH:adrenodoxin oxidoreductase, mitochondrial [Fopius arisanus]|uniref:NADPH:adrenodoxin oxidoreductase, mitochondrial n=1 Tax=Fopius arisanus TaxID=64838 RepID=A0A9R1TX88_9HYME|nr:PREDICTED: NADPH:adrenodoxin oxidoreductase, mitochondrial [Fopius arisanus]XP_011299352.1 PREDICTED: NADPH:adrenodoxin oxidoreductase, mitochondrial [Fopius arisanus]XP_011299353.1 PREDICTED: NADPH:adrenodoxin oxidoreductase, mitochondrial [Fopius arisanus]
MMGGVKVLQCVRNFCTKAPKARICIVGAGPAGFYAAQQLLKTANDVEVDVIERLPVPFGLVRFGVAPDHPEVKNVINTFKKTAKNPRLKFLGNVNVGKDLTITELRSNYHAVLLTYGAEEDRILGIPGEKLSNVISGRQFVGWYNGVPSDSGLEINLNVEEAVILGQGNVAVDIARILLTPVDELKKTDITCHALDHLSVSKIRRVWMVGRRGPLQAAFTIAELREMTKLKNCSTIWRPEDFTGVADVVPTLVRPRKRLTELMLKNLSERMHPENSNSKQFLPIFRRGPKEIIGSTSVEKIKLSVNKLEGEDILDQKAVATNESEEIPCGLVLRSIGYKSVPIEPSVPFDPQRGRVVNSSGKIGDNLYAAGWVATGPVGVILSTMTNAFNVASLILEELKPTQSKPGSEEIMKILKSRNIRPVSYQEWEKIDNVEQERGKVKGKPREKIVDVNEMLEIAFS